jgi:hypothetical protein
MAKKAVRPTNGNGKHPQPAPESRALAIRHILDQMGEGRSLRKICSEDKEKIEGLPAASSFCRWVDEDTALAEQYARAREGLMEYWAQRITELGELAREEAVALGREEIPAGPVVNAYRLEADNLKWLLSKLAPKKYGERLELAGDGNAPLVVQYTTVVKAR